MKFLYLLIVVFGLLLAGFQSAAQCTFTAGISAGTAAVNCGPVELTASTNAPGTWTQRAGLSVGRTGGVGFSIGNKGYVGTGLGSGLSYLNDFWEYDPQTNAWTQKANFGGTGRFGAVAFSIGNKGYVGTGTHYSGGSNLPTADFWQYDPATNTWQQKANLNAPQRSMATGFALGTKGYLGTGANALTNTYLADFWEYDPATDTWTQKTSFPGVGREQAASFTIGNKGYIGTGNTNTNYTADFWEYDPATDSWAQKANFGGGTAQAMTGLSLNGKGYVCTGDINNGVTGAFWEYDATANSWTQKPNFGGSARDGGCGFAIGNTAYVGFGYSYATSPYEMPDLWAYAPNVTYIWSTSSTGASATATASGTYSVAIANGAGCIVTATQSVTVIPVPLVTITGPSTLCAGSSIVLTANGAATYSWSANASGVTTNTILVSLSAAAIYTVTGQAGGCTATATRIAVVEALPLITTSLTNSLICAGESTSLIAHGADSYTWNIGAPQATLAIKPNLTTTYTVTGTATDGCTSTAVVTQSVSDCTGIAFGKNQSQAIIVYPNPTGGLLNIYSEILQAPFTVELYNYLGQLIVTEVHEAGRQQLNLDNVPAGIYTLRINAGKNSLLTTKIVKE